MIVLMSSYLLVSTVFLMVYVLSGDRTYLRSNFFFLAIATAFLLTYNLLGFGIVFLNGYIYEYIAWHTKISESWFLPKGIALVLFTSISIANFWKKNRDNQNLQGGIYVLLVLNLTICYISGDWNNNIIKPSWSTVIYKPNYTSDIIFTSILSLFMNWLLIKTKWLPELCQP